MNKKLSDKMLSNNIFSGNLIFDKLISDNLISDNMMLSDLFFFLEPSHTHVTNRSAIVNSITSVRITWMY
jgi:hypothetical protein